MSRLTWTERDHGWRAGPYEIELVAPELWVCSRRARNGAIRVEATSGSLTALKWRVERLDSRRRSLRRMIFYSIAFLLSIFAAFWAVTLSGSLAPAFVMGFSVIGIWAALKAVDCLIQRSWESLRLHYQ